MNSEFVSWLIVLEVALPFFVLSMILIFVLIKGQKKNKEAARNLILKIKNNEDNEKDALLAFLTEKISLSDKDAKKVSKKIINERKFLFRNLISALLDKNTDAIASLESDMSRITSHYHALEVTKVVEDVVPEVDEGEQEKKEELKQEIKSLKQEVHITLTTLNNIFAEFSSMFGEEVPETEMSVDQIITAMESFSGKSAVPDSNSEAEGQEEESDAFVEADLDEEASDVFAEAGIDAGEPDAFAEVENALDDIAADGGTKTDSDSDSASASDSDAIEIDTAAPSEEVEVPQDEPLSFSLDDELDDIDSALDELELGSSQDEEEPSWDEAFEESGDKKPDEI